MSSPAPSLKLRGTPRWTKKTEGCGLTSATYRDESWSRSRGGGSTAGTGCLCLSTCGCEARYSPGAGGRKVNQIRRPGRVSIDRSASRHGSSESVGRTRTKDNRGKHLILIHIIIREDTVYDLTRSFSRSAYSLWNRWWPTSIPRSDRGAPPSRTSPCVRVPVHTSFASETQIGPR